MKKKSKIKFTDLEKKIIKTFVNHSDIVLPIYWNLDDEGIIWLDEDSIRDELECRLKDLYELLSKQNNKIKKLMLKNRLF